MQVTSAATQSASVTASAGPETTELNKRSPVQFAGLTIRRGDDVRALATSLKKAGAEVTIKEGEYAGINIAAKKGKDRFFATFFGSKRPLSGTVDSMALLSGNKDKVGFSKLVIGSDRSTYLEHIPLLAGHKEILEKGLNINGTRVNLGMNIQEMGRKLGVTVYPGVAGHPGGQSMMINLPNGGDPKLTVTAHIMGQDEYYGGGISRIDIEHHRITDSGFCGLANNKSIEEQLDFNADGEAVYRGPGSISTTAGKPYSVFGFGVSGDSNE